MTAIAQSPVSPVDQYIQLTIPFTNHAEQLSALVLHRQTDTHAHIQAHLSRYQLQSATCEEREKVTVTASKLAATIVHAIEEEKLTWTLISDTNTDKQTVAINYHIPHHNIYDRAKGVAA